jgi:serine/threonine-protein kinase
VDSAEQPNAGQITRIGKYDIVGLLGRGGMGVVYKGIDRSIGREVAIKTLTSGISNDPDMLARFYDEGRKTGSFKHPNIVTVYELGDHNGVPYIAMELVDGNPLDRLIRADRPLPIVECLRIIEELCSALAYAHRANVIHRDVKPANIFVQPDGMVKLLDFGIARLGEKTGKELSLTRVGHIIGTLDYMAPERLRDKPLDGRSDLYAAGVVLYQLVCGQLPFTGEDTVMMQRILNEPHPPLSSKRANCPPALDRVIDRALAKPPNDRYSTAEELASELSTIIADIRQEYAEKMLPEAKRLIEAQELLEARSVLLQMLKIRTTHNTEARALLAGIQRQLSQRQREERVQQIRVQAESLLKSGELDKSGAVLDEGLEIDPASPELTKLRQRVEKEKEKHKRVSEFLRQANSARHGGDYQEAISLARKAIKVDKSNSKSFTLLNQLLKEAEDAEKRAEVKALLQSAGKQLAAQCYHEAIELLQKAELLDPNNVELQLLMLDANSGLEQVRRKELVSRLENEAQAAESLEDLKKLAQDIRDAMVTMPADSALVMLLGKIDRDIREQEKRRLVDDTTQACRNLLPHQALALVQKARRDLPGDERLLALEGLLTERVRKQTAEERRDEYLAQAREAISNKVYAEAIRILEGCQREGIATSEIDTLLEFARHEESEQQRQKLLNSRVIRAQSLIADSRFDEAIEFLNDALQQSEEPPLRMLLNQAIDSRDLLLKHTETVLASAGKLVRAGKFEEAVQFLQGQPPPVLQSRRVRTAEAAISEQQQQAAFRMIGRAYTVIDSELPAAESTIQWVVSALGETPFAGSVAGAFRGRMQAVADRAILDLIPKCKIVLRNRDRAGAGELVKQASEFVQYGGARAKANWQSFLNQAAKSGLLARPRDTRQTQR